MAVAAADLSLEHSAIVAAAILTLFCIRGGVKLYQTRGINAPSLLARIFGHSFYNKEDLLVLYFGNISWIRVGARWGQGQSHSSEETIF